jgi:ribosomal protein L16 Arg81 hydroxylase
VDAAGHELEALLSPVSPEVFVHEHWGRKPLFVKGFKEKYRGFFDGEAFDRALAGPGPFPPEFAHASYDKKTAAPAIASGAPAKDIASPTFAIRPDQARELCANGATICVSQMELRLPPLARFVAAIKRQLGYIGRVGFNAYLSPAHVGFNWHFDARIASTLQIEGTKRWRFSNRAAVEWPRANGVLRSDGTGRYSDARAGGEAWERLPPFDEKDTTEVLLEPGDLLVLPAGTWHDACGGAEGSLALNLSFTPVAYTAILGNLLDAAMRSDSGWRGPMPLLALDGGLPGEVDPRGLEAVAAQLTRAAETLRSLAADGAPLVRMWATAVRTLPGIAPEPRPTPPPPVTVTDRLRVRPDGNYYARSADGGTRLVVSVGAGGIDVTGPSARFVQRVLATKEFAAADCLSWGAGDWSQVADALTHLLREGLLERVT